MAVRQHVHDCVVSASAGGVQVVPPSVDRVRNVLDLPRLDSSQATYRSPSAPTCNAWKLRVPNALSDAIVTGVLHVTPSSFDVARRSELMGNRRLGTTLATAYRAYRVASGPYEIFGGASPCGSIGPNESRSSDGEPPVDTYSRPSVPPPGAEIHATARSPVGDSANIGAAPTDVGALTVSGASSVARASASRHPPTDTRSAPPRTR